MPVLCLLYTAKQKKREEKRLADLLGLGSGIVDTPSYISRVVKIFSEALILSISYIAFARLPTYLRLVRLFQQRPSKLRR